MAYKNYTTQFDRMVSVSELPKSGVFERFNSRRRLKRYLETVGDLKTTVANLLAKTSQPANIGAEFNDTIATIIIDHSGSLNCSGKAEICLCISETLIHAFEQLGIKHEVLGFTTESWQGGKSRQLWLQNGKPENPGRLCELLHIIYRTHDDSPERPVKGLRNLLHPALLKENIDGEALEWAETRLRGRSEKRKLLFHISDGAPVDHSTILANSPTYLVDHLTSIIRRLENDDDIELFGVGVHHRVDEYFSHSVQVETIDEAPDTLIAFLTSIL